MPPRAVLPLSAPDPPNRRMDIATTPTEHQESPVDAGLDDDDDYDLELLPQEKRIQLALAASQAGLVSQRKAALYYRVPRSTVQDRVKGRLTRGEAHIHERLLTRPQEDVLTEWIKVLTLSPLIVVF
ncbi:hypothetical protein DFH07DRAFT_926544 [Mycena maculata]|uniref:HTH psq-type domain-containing protein n=1 Tax=Mycena maculata TaxID=230809 RepID=A0AAD7IF69_9AGAR|nr:hypothetical protein DFH07DRAFT_926544 [Mycena maculata]